MRLRTISLEATLPYVRLDAGPDAEHLVVTFPKLAPGVTKPTTNLIEALEPLGAHRLCIGADEHTFIGPRREQRGIRTAIKLIRGEAKRLGVPRENVIAVGSSMGGVCALFLGLGAGVGRIMAGAPPVRMGRQLAAFTDIDGPSKAARRGAKDFIALADRGDGLAIRYLDLLIPRMARTVTEPTVIDLFVSPHDRGYGAVRSFHKRLSGHPHIESRLTLGEYPAHGNIREAFLPFVLETLGAGMPRRIDFPR